MQGNRGRSAASCAIAITVGATLGVVGWTGAPAAAAAPEVTATLVRTINTSTMTPPIPDPAGIVYLPARDHFLISDSEVDETPVFQNANVFETTRTGTIVDRGLTTPQTKEAAGIGHNPTNDHVYVSDDDQFRIHEFAPGPDGRYATSDDTRTSFSTAAFGSTDPEDVTYFPPTGELFVLDGADHDVHRIDPGPNGRFDGIAPTGDDTATEFDVQRYGAEDPEGIGFHPGRGTLVVVDSTSEAVYEFNRELHARGHGRHRGLEPGLRRWHHRRARDRRPRTFRPLHRRPGRRQRHGSRTRTTAASTRCASTFRRSETWHRSSTQDATRRWRWARRST